jgi:arachidonate 15-lipoxygenase
MIQTNLNNTNAISGDKNEKSRSLIKVALILVALYIQRRYFVNDTYEYNYNYLQPLGITNVPESKLLEKIFKISLPNLPKGSFPSLLWVVKVVFYLIIIAINNSLAQHSSSLSEFETSLTEIKSDLDSIGSDLEQLENQESLKTCVNKLELTLKQIDQDLDLDSQLKKSRQQQPFLKKETWFENLVENHFLEVDNKIAELLKIKQREDSSQTAFDDSAIISTLQKIVKYGSKIAEIADAQEKDLALSSESITLDDYNKLYQIIAKPAIADVFQEDLIFAYLQVAGANPLVLEQFTQTDFRLLITPEKYTAIATKFGVTDSLSTALAEGRLYVSDYKLLNSLVNGNYINPNLVQQKYSSAPIALFAVPPEGSATRSLFPVAISYQKTSISEQWLLFTPLDADNQGEPWMTAKNIVQMADCNYHELISHLGRTHLVVEAFIVPTYDKLPEDHPVRTLLIPHFEGTVLINYGAHALLVAPGGAVDSLLAATVGADQSLSAKGTQSYLFNFNTINFPQTLVNRGVNNTDTLPTYPYRDDGQLIWDAIHTWVNDYVSIHYQTDADVVNDQDLQTWASTLASLDGGRVENFGEDQQGQIKTRNYLVKALSTIIFTASAQHAAVNFPQKSLMMYVPGFPLARYLAPPTTVQDQESFISGLPSLSQAQNQINTLYLLGSVYYTQLGQYSSTAFPENAQLEAALSKFQDNLNKATDIIYQRNQSPQRLMSYEYLLPEKIPQSINI